MAATEESRIGKGTKVSGNLHFHGAVRIEGEADGEIVGDEIVIAEGAMVSAKITATRPVSYTHLTLPTKRIV